MTPRRLPRLPLQRGIERLEDRLLLTGSPIMETEANNDITQANAITVTANSPATVTGEINVGGDVDLYQITLNFGDTFSAAITAYDPNVQYSLVSDLRLFDSTGAELTNVPFGASDPSLQFIDNVAGTSTYYLGVSDITNTAYDATDASNQGDSSYLFIGPYTLDLSVTSLVDAGDTIGNAAEASVSPGQPTQLSGIVDAGGDADLYHVSLNTGDTLDVTTDTSTLGGLNTNLRLFNSLGQSVTATGSGNHLNFVAAAAGDYYVGVSADDNLQYDATTSNSGTGTETGDYFVNFLVTPQDNDDTAATAHSVSFLRDQAAPTQTGRIANPLDVDFYRLDHLVVGDKLQLNVDTSSVNSSLAARLRVFGPNGAINPDSGTGLGSTQTYTIATAGTYYIGISGAENAAYNPAVSGSGTASATLGDYQLGIEVDSAAALSTETEPNNVPTAPNVILANGGSVSGSITSGDVDYYMFTVGQSGLFTAHVNSPGSNLDSQLTLSGSNQQPIFSSDDTSLGNVDPALQIHLAPGTYWLQVKASSAAAAGMTTGSYTLSTTFTPASSPFAPQPTGPDDSSGLYPYSIASADLNGDGIPDLVTADYGSNQVSVLLGVKLPGTGTPRGDFSYSPAILTTVGNTPVAVIASEVTLNNATAKLDFNGDGFADVAVVNSADNTVEILLGDGQGNFTPGETINVGNSPSALVAGDFNGDGIADLAVTNSADGTTTIFIGQSDGNGHANGDFVQSGSPISVGNPLANPGEPAVSNPVAIIAGDFDGDGKLDLATADSGDDTVTVLYGDGHGGFGNTAQDVQVLQLAPGSQPTSLVAAKFNSKINGFTDFAVADAATDTVSMILGQGNRTFHVNDPIVVRLSPQITVASEYMTSVAMADFNGDGLADLVVSNIGDSRITVALGRGNGTFAPGKQFASNAHNSPRGIVTADLNNDGRVDFVTADGIPATVVSVFGGRGDGTFLSAPQLQTNQGPLNLAVTDFNDDGYADIVTANSTNASLLFGNGDATFQSSTTVSAGPANTVAIGDFNGDGRPDFVVTNYLDPNSGSYLGQLTVLLGKGDGTFAATDTDPITLTPGDFAVAVGDFNGDGHLDLAVTNQFDGTVTALLGDGSGNFTALTPITVGSSPEALAVGDFNGDGNLDVATSNFGDGTISVLFGDGAGGFSTPQTVAVGQQPGQLAVANFNGDKSSSGHDIQDIAVKSSTDNVVRILFGAADAGENDNFANDNAAPLELAVGDNTQDPVFYPEGIVAADFNGDGLVDLATTNSRTNDVSVFINQGNGQFAAEQRFAIGDAQNPATQPDSIVVGDFNRDGRLDLATSNADSNNVSILLGDGTGKFALPDRFGSANVAKAPLLVDLNGDGTPDSVTMDAQGRVLLRLGRPGQPGVFAPPQVINAAAVAGGSTAADFAVFNDGSQHLIGVLNRAAGQNSQNSVFTLYRIGHTGVPHVVSTLQLGAHYDRIAAAKLNGDNRDDLAVLDSASGTLAKFVRSGTGFVASGTPTQIANAPSALLAANFGSAIDGLLVASSQTGTLNLLNSAGSMVDYRASTAPIGLDVQDVTTTFDGAASLASGNLNDLDDSIGDMAVVHGGTNTVSILLGKSGGGFVDPQPGQVIQTASQPIAVAIGKFNADKHSDLAILEADGRVEIFLGDGHGNFALGGSYDVGTSPVGISVNKVNGDNKNDLMISNRAGDVVTLLGNGDGTFRTFTRAGQTMSLAVDGGNVVVTNQSSDRVVVPGSSSASQRDDGVNAPTAVRLTDNLGNSIDLNADGLPDMVVANSGANNVLVYLGAAGGGFDLAHPLSFATGTDPVDVEVADINGDSKQDVIVTNYGSNDVSILLGTGDSSVDATTGKSNLLKPGVRLNVGQGPVSTQVVLQPGHANPDLLVTNSISNSVYLLPGVGGGFFNDVTPTQFLTGSNPVQTVVGNFNEHMGFVTLNYASNSLTFYSSFSGGGAGQEISSGGTSPLTAVAFGLNSDGTTDLIVGNNGNGVFSVFEGDQAGLSLVNSFTGDALEHPAALAIMGQGQDLQLLALDEGDESVHVFDRSSVTGPGPQTLIPAQSELASFTTGVLGINTSGLNIVFSLISALGISIEGFLDQSFTADATGGDGRSNHPLTTDFFENLGSALDSGHQLVNSALEGLGGVLGMHLDDGQVGAAVEDVMSLIFPHLPWQAIPSLIHGVIDSASHRLPQSPFATDQALEQIQLNPFELSMADMLLGVTEAVGNVTVAGIGPISFIPIAKTLADRVASAPAPRAGAPSDVAAGQGNAENTADQAASEKTTTASPMSPASMIAPKNIAMNRRLVGASDASNRISRAMQMSLGLPVSNPAGPPSVKRNSPLRKFASNRPQAAEIETSSTTLLALAAVMGSIGAGGWAQRFRRDEKQNNPYSLD